MNVYGNGGMLTTVGDWMKWNTMLDSDRWAGRWSRPSKRKAC